MKVVAFLPAKGTSERIESKNKKKLNGKSLFLHTLEKLMQCEFIDEVYLDSESDEILEKASYLGYIPLKRSLSFATNQTDGHQMFTNEVSQVEADIYIQILCTSPFISIDTIRKGVDILKNETAYDSVVLVKKEKQYLWEEGQPLYDKHHVPNSCELPDTIIESMGLYMTTKECAQKNKRRFGNNVYMLTADALETIDVNYSDEFILAETIMRGLAQKENQEFQLLSKFLNSAVFSDILSEMGMDNVITGLSLNLENKRIMGRANTLKIRALNDGEDYRNIYKGLESYEEMSQGEVIIVENEIPDRAYFGELNASFAIRAGAQATIIGGVTRDVNEVSMMDYPVFSEGYCSKDVRYYGAIEGHQCPIKIREVTVNPGDIIFADRCGVVCIPKKYEKEVIKKAYETMNKESRVRTQILLNKNAKDIFDKEGEF